MQIAYCDECGKRIALRSATVSGQNEPVLCRKCGGESTSDTDGEQTGKAVPGRKGRSANGRRNVGASNGPAAVQTNGTRVAGTGLHMKTVLLAGLVCSALVLSGVYIGYLMFARHTDSPHVQAAAQVQTDSGRWQPEPAERGAPSAPVAAGTETTGSLVEEPSATQLEPPLPVDEEPSGIGTRPPLGATGDQAEDETEAADLVTHEPTESGAIPPVAVDELQEKAETQTTLDAPELPEQASEEPATPVTEEKETLPDKPSPRPNMPESVMRSLKEAARKHARYDVLAPVITLCSNYRFDIAVKRLREEAPGDGIWETTANEVERAGRALAAIADAIEKRIGKPIEVKMSAGTVRGVVTAYTSGRVRVTTSSGIPSMVSLKRMPVDLLKELASDMTDEDLNLFHIYCGRGLPDGVSPDVLSPNARLIVEHRDWAEREKSARRALEELRKLREEGKWPEAISSAVQLAQDFMDTFAVGVAARQELGATLREAIDKKTKVIEYRRGASPTEDYAGVTDTYISTYSINGDPEAPRSEKWMNYGAKTEMVLWSTTRRSLLRFDLSGLPRDAKVHRATLEIFCDKIGYAGKSEVVVFLAGEDWVEGDGQYGKAKKGATWEYRDALASTKWSTPGGSYKKGDFGGQGLDIVANGTATPQKWTILDVTPGVRAVVEQGVANNGFLLTLGGAREGRVSFMTSEIGDTNLRPKLTLEYEGTVRGEEAVVPDELQWLLYEAAPTDLPDGMKGVDVELEDVEI